MPRKRKRPVIVELRDGTTAPTEVPSKMNNGNGNLASKSATVLMILLVGLFHRAMMSAPSVRILITELVPMLMAHDDYGC